MTMELAVDIMRNLLQTGLILAIPILGTATVVGLLVSFIQGITSLQEQTLTFVPKLVCVSLAIVLSANFILKTLTEFCISMINMLPTMAQWTIEASQIIVWVLVFLRTGAFFMGIPLFAGKMIPTKIRTAFGLLLSLLIKPGGSCQP